MKFTLQQIGLALGAVVPEPSVLKVAEGWSIDSRTLQAGDVFFALRGPNHNGHAHLAEIWSKGAVAAIVDEAAVESSGCLLRVGNTLDALQHLATWAREQWGGRVIAVTGSAGKTTTKDVIAELLSVKMKTARSEGNLNNHIGLPLSLLRLDPETRVMVVEMGMNHAGEIRRLAEIAKPDVGVVTNVGHAHVEYFTSIEGVAAAKGELIEALPSTGTAVLNADDPYVSNFAHPHRILYGESEFADVRAQDVLRTIDGWRFRVGNVRFHAHLAGRHNVSNILAGIAVAGIYGIAPRQLTEPIAHLQPGKMRGERIEHNGIIIYNDCYNSNPAAVRAMLDVLRGTPARKRLAVLGEMQELGAEADCLHRAIGIYAAANKVDALIGVQGKAAEMVASAKSAGIAHAYLFQDAAEAGTCAAQLAAPGDAILFKGSRAVRVEDALLQFMKNGGQN